MGKYIHKDGSGKLLNTISLVLPARKLESVQVADDSHIVTVASTEGVWPGMAWHGPHMQTGVRAWVHAVVSTTKLEIWACKWDAAAGMYTLVAANAHATADDVAEGNLATVHGFGWQPHIMWTPQGVWTNNIEATGSLVLPVGYSTASLSSSMAGATLSQFPFAINPNYKDEALDSKMLTIGEPELYKSDSLMETPLRRHNGVPQGGWVLVSVGGYQSVIPAAEGSCVFGGLDEADEVSVPPPPP